MTWEAGDPRLPELRRRWRQFTATPAPAGGEADPRLQEILLYAAWLGPVAAAALDRGGRLSPLHARMLAQRRREEGGELWSAVGELGEQARTFVARLKALEETLAELPVES